MRNMHERHQNQGNICA
uniref:Uncharacterized protein n=1 Tax=Rhizophora mucronata TaxID=61149 RepID=A0A2P2P0D9_RHIMU